MNRSICVNSAYVRIFNIFLIFYLHELTSKETHRRVFQKQQQQQHKNNNKQPNKNPTKLQDSTSTAVDNGYRSRLLSVLSSFDLHMNFITLHRVSLQLSFSCVSLLHWTDQNDILLPEMVTLDLMLRTLKDHIKKTNRLSLLILESPVCLPV